MNIELLKMAVVHQNSDEVDRILRVFDVDDDSEAELYRLAYQLADTMPLYVLDDSLDAWPAAQILPKATDMQHVKLAMWLGGRWELYDVAAVVVNATAYVDQPQWNVIYGMPAFDE